MMHTYRKAHGLWTVGYWRPNSRIGSRPGAMEWEPLTDFDNEKDAMERVNYLNGGNSHVNTYVMEA